MADNKQKWKTVKLLLLSKNNPGERLNSENNVESLSKHFWNIAKMWSFENQPLNTKEPYEVKEDPRKLRIILLLTHLFLMLHFETPTLRQGPLNSDLSVCPSVLLSVRPSVCPSVCPWHTLLRTGSLVFLGIVLKVRENDIFWFWKKVYIFPKIGKMGEPKISIFLCKQLIWENPGS